MSDYEPRYPVGTAVWWRQYGRDFEATVVMDANGSWVRVNLGRDPVQGRPIIRRARMSELRLRDNSTGGGAGA